MMKEGTYRSRIDSWFLVVLLAGAGLAIFAAISVMLSGALSSIVVGLAVIVIVIVLGAGLPLWLLCSTRYVIAERELNVHSGPFTWTIALDRIESIEPSRSPLSSPALSLDRLQIRYGKGKRLMISPKDRDAFLAHLERARERAG